MYSRPRTHTTEHARHARKKEFRLVGIRPDIMCQHKHPCDTPLHDDLRYRGKCGGCVGKCQPCDDATPPKCGEWQDCTCSPDGCGDGHDCMRYIDITFTIEDFVIQGLTCCDANVPLAQPCDGALQNNETPISGSPAGWGNVTGGVQEPVTYQSSTHHVRLTRASCQCLWGGVWTSTCDCNTCCCADAGGQDAYEDCPEGDAITCQAPGDCHDYTGASCAPCQDDAPDFYPCYPNDNGYASSLDDWGGVGGSSPSEQGGSLGQGLCVTQLVDPAEDPCEYIGGDCDSWIAAGGAGYACWECGTFKPHHIEAIMSFETSPTTCDSGGLLEIRGLTEASRSQMGLSVQDPALDCIGTGDATDCGLAGGGGSGEPALAYQGRWWGKTSGCNENCLDSAYDDLPQPELEAYGCSCPPETSFDSTVLTDGSLSALHPTGLYNFSQPGTATGAGIMSTCVVSDAWCDTPAYVATNPPCTDGNCYGAPYVWWDYCNYCDLCGCNGDWQNACDGCTGSNCLTRPCPCCCNSQCTCPPPNPLIPINGIPDDLQPCKHCGTVPANNDPSCNPCPTPSGESRMCAEVHISIVPSNNPKPWWAAL